MTGDAAVLVTPADSEELAAVLRRLHDDPAERAALADRALRRVGERFAWPAVARATVAAYREAMGNRGRPAAGQRSRPPPRRARRAGGRMGRRGRRADRGLPPVSGPARTARA